MKRNWSRDRPGMLIGLVADILLILGGVLISLGAGAVFPPAGLIVGGGIMIAYGVILGRGGGEP